MSAAPETVSISIKMLSGDILPLSVSVITTARKVYRRIHDALPEEMRPWHLSQMSLISLRDEKTVPHTAPLFEAEEGECFLLTMTPNRYEVYVDHVQQVPHVDGTMMSIYRARLTAPNGIDACDFIFYLYEGRRCFVQMDIFHTRTGAVRFTDFASVYSPANLMRQHIQRAIESISEETVDELCATFLEKLEQDRQERSDAKDN